MSKKSSKMEVADVFDYFDLSKIYSYQADSDYVITFTELKTNKVYNFPASEAIDFLEMQGYWHPSREKKLWNRMKKFSTNNSVYGIKKDTLRFKHGSIFTGKIKDYLKASPTGIRLQIDNGPLVATLLPAFRSVGIQSVSFFKPYKGMESLRIIMLDGRKFAIVAPSMVVFGVENGKLSFPKGLIKSKANPIPVKAMVNILESLS